MTLLARLRSGAYAGVPFMLLAMIVFAGNDALAKHLSGLFAVAQILAIRSAAGLVATTPVNTAQATR